jgi:hypothetical protein
MGLKARWFTSVRERKLFRVSKIVFWTGGFLAGAVVQAYWHSRPVEAFSVAVIVYFIAQYIFDRVEERVIGDKIPIVFGGRHGR